MLLALGVVAAYLVGTFPTAQLVAWVVGANDPTQEGSGNPGASNVYRIAGKRAGVAVGVIDALKGAIPVGIALAVAGSPEAHAVWVASVAGHVWPATRRFRGGKGVATGGGGGLVISPVIGLACGALFFVVVRFGRVAALGSLSIAVAFPFVSAMAGRPAGGAVGAGVACPFCADQSNIRRMLQNREAKV